MDGLAVSTADLTVFVHPSMSSDVPRAVRRQLSSLLFTYEEQFDGVLLAHEFRILQKHAKILPGLIPYFGVRAKAKLLLFSPRPGMLLEGKVMKLGKESIHLVVLGFCSAAIMLDDIQGFQHQNNGEVEAFVSSSHSRHTIKAGSMIRFLVKSVDVEILHITGSLGAPYTGSIRWLFKHGMDIDSQPHSGSKHKRDSREEQFLDGSNKSRKRVSDM